MATHIVTEYVYPPIPDRRWDWLAYDFSIGPEGPCGRGPTEEAAITDLRERIES